MCFEPSSMLDACDGAAMQGGKVVHMPLYFFLIIVTGQSILDEHDERC